MATLLDLLNRDKRRKVADYNAAMQSSPVIPPYIRDEISGPGRQEAEAKRAQMLLANEGGLTTAQLGGGAERAWANEPSYAYHSPTNKYRYDPLGTQEGDAPLGPPAIMTGNVNTLGGYDAPVGEVTTPEEWDKSRQFPQGDVLGDAHKQAMQKDYIRALGDYELEQEITRLSRLTTFLQLANPDARISDLSATLRAEKASRKLSTVEKDTNRFAKENLFEYLRKNPTRTQSDMETVLKNAGIGPEQLPFLKEMHDITKLGKLVSLRKMHPDGTGYDVALAYEGSDGYKAKVSAGYLIDKADVTFSLQAAKDQRKLDKEARKDALNDQALEEILAMRGQKWTRAMFNNYLSRQPMEIRGYLNDHAEKILKVDSNYQWGVDKAGNPVQWKKGEPAPDGVVPESFAAKSATSQVGEWEAGVIARLIDPLDGLGREKITKDGVVTSGRLTVDGVNLAINQAIANDPKIVALMQTSGMTREKIVENIEKGVALNRTKAINVAGALANISQATSLAEAHRLFNVEVKKNPNIAGGKEGLNAQFKLLLDNNKYTKVDKDGDEVTFSYWGGEQKEVGRKRAGTGGGSLTVQGTGEVVTYANDYEKGKLQEEYAGQGGAVETGSEQDLYTYKSDRIENKIRVGFDEADEGEGPLVTTEMGLEAKLREMRALENKDSLKVPYAAARDMRRDVEIIENSLKSIHRELSMAGNEGRKPNTGQFDGAIITTLLKMKDKSQVTEGELQSIRSRAGTAAKIQRFMESLHSGSILDRSSRAAALATAYIYAQGETESFLRSMQSQKNIYAKMGGGLELVGQLLDGAYPETDALKGYDYAVDSQTVGKGLNYAKNLADSWRAFSDRQPTLVTGVSEVGDEELTTEFKTGLPVKKHDSRALRRSK